MKSSHIAIILPGFSASESDWCIPAILDMVRKLAETHQVDVFPMRYPHSSTPYQVYGINVFPQNGRTQAGIYRFSLMMRTIQAVIKRHRNKPYDLIHALWVDEPGLAGVILSRLLRLPLCASVMGGEFVNLKEISYGHQRSITARLMTRISVKFADVVTVGSNQLKEQVKSFTNQPIQVAPLGVDTTRFTKRQASDQHNSPLRLLTVGSLIPVKNHEMLLMAFSKLTDQGIIAHLDIVGTGPLEEHLKDVCNQMGIAERVIFHGAVEHHHLPELYRQADLCILTSWHESQSLVALEAGASGIATIGTRVGILPELVPENLLVAPGDSETLSQKLYRCAMDAHFLQQVNDSIHQSVIEDYTLSKSIERWNRIYTALVS